MRLDTALDSIGAEVTYTAYPDAEPETGRIVSASTHPNHVVVRYGSDALGKLTPVALIEFTHQIGDPNKLHASNSEDPDPLRRCDNGGCRRRHTFVTKCSCGARIADRTRRGSLLRAREHQLGREAQA